MMQSVDHTIKASLRISINSSVWSLHGLLLLLLICSSSCTWLPLLSQKYFWSFHEAWGKLALPQPNASAVFASARSLGNNTIRRSGQTEVITRCFRTHPADAHEILMQYTRRLVGRLHFSGTITLLFIFLFLLLLWAALQQPHLQQSGKNGIVSFRFALVLRGKPFGIPVRLFPVVFACFILHSFRGTVYPAVRWDVPSPSWSFAMYSLCSYNW